MRLPHDTFEDVIVLLGGGAGGIGPRDAERVAQFREEQRIIGALLAALAALPAGDEALDLVVCLAGVSRRVLSTMANRNSTVTTSMVRVRIRWPRRPLPTTVR